MTESTRVVVVGMFDSIHFARWLSQFSESKIQFWLFPSSPQRRVHSELKTLCRNHPESYHLFPFSTLFALPLWVLDKWVKNRLRGYLLSRLIHSKRPDVVHAIELQNAGYLVSDIWSKLPSPYPHLIVTNYGSDIYWFSRFARHRKRIIELLEKADRYSAECERDHKLAEKLGFSGQKMPVFPNAGGFAAALLDREIASHDKRTLIAVKGYHGWVGRAHIALQALEAISSELHGYEILVYSCNLSTKRLAARMAKRTGLKVSAYSKGALSHDEMLEKFSQSLIYVGVSLSDGISTSMLEAMAMGAIPVQTTTACCDEWFSDTGVAIKNVSADDVAQGIKKAIGLALATDSAAKNRETIRARAAREEISKQALAFYQF